MPLGDCSFYAVIRDRSMAMRYILILALVLFPHIAEAKIPRSATVLHSFQRLHPCPSTRLKSGACHGWVKDHIKPLACGGADAVWNLQWQTIIAAKAKDRWERRDCTIWSVR